MTVLPDCSQQQLDQYSEYFFADGHQAKQLSARYEPLWCISLPF
ncbi:hypothetical protein HMPREF0454_04072 [Hafnia alvei ATCC 51873]|uniref:Uncharacterized protein n=1 Tax=Hafnia alvei ATCC 51873 TaxID=1002364 RepID=G9YBP3_HAFAL|nr:hypothetical protein HMPREF0454_04072 [Hafnia alvei ATCC 51873]